MRLRTFETMPAPRPEALVKLLPCLEKKNIIFDRYWRDSLAVWLVGSSIFEILCSSRIVGSCCLWTRETLTNTVIKNKKNCCAHFIQQTNKLVNQYYNTINK